MVDEAGWTIETLLIHLTAIMDERDRHYQQMFNLQEKAVFMALTQVIDDFRTDITDQLTGFLPRSEYDRSLGGLAKRLDDLNNTLMAKIDAALQTFTSQIEVVETRMSTVEAVVR